MSDTRYSVRLWNGVTKKWKDRLSCLHWLLNPDYEELRDVAYELSLNQAKILDLMLRSGLITLDDVNRMVDYRIEESCHD